MKVPVELKTIPILEAVYEVRFDTDLPPDTVVGIIFNVFKSDFKDAVELPVKSLPLEVREKDLNLRYQPHMRMKSNDNKFLLQFGQRVVSLHFSAPHYDRWENFESKIIDVSEKIESLKVAKSFNRVGLRYIDFFEESIIPDYSFDLLNLSVSVAGRGQGESFSCSSTFIDNKAKHKVQVFKDHTITHLNTERTGDLIDLDTTFLDLTSISTFSEIASKTSEIHEEQKKIFFDLIGEKVTKLLEPTYE